MFLPDLLNPQSVCRSEQISIWHFLQRHKNEKNIERNRKNSERKTISSVKNIPTQMPRSPRHRLFSMEVKIRIWFRWDYPNEKEQILPKLEFVRKQQN